MFTPLAFGFIERETIMSAHIDFETKTDRELLVMVAAFSNLVSEETLPAIMRRLDALNATVVQHGLRLLEMETRCHYRHRTDYRKVSAAATAGVSGIGTVVYFIGNFLSWW
jgi:hypothetical protein